VLFHDFRVIFAIIRVYLPFFVVFFAVFAVFFFFFSSFRVSFFWPAYFPNHFPIVSQPFPAIFWCFSNHFPPVFVNFPLIFAVFSLIFAVFVVFLLFFSAMAEWIGKHDFDLKEDQAPSAALEGALRGGERMPTAKNDSRFPYVGIYTRKTAF
jgi:hypothetical protein